MIEELLRSLKMQGALEGLPQLNKIEDRDLFLINLLETELEFREIRSAKRRLSQAKFPTDKDWDDLDRKLNPSIDFKKIQFLGKGDFIKDHENVCFVGQQGTGKTHSLIALGRQLCRQGISTKFYTACGLVNALEEAKASHELSKFMQKILSPQLLIIDELGFIPFSESGARLLFDVFAQRYERGSVAVSSNLSFDKWVQIFGTPELTAALVDRFTHKCVIHNFVGQSVRLLAAQNRRRKVAKLKM